MYVSLGIYGTLSNVSKWVCHIRILVVGDVVIRTNSFQVSGRESRDKWYGGIMHHSLNLFFYLYPPICIPQSLYLRLISITLG